MTRAKKPRKPKKGERACEACGTPYAAPRDGRGWKRKYCARKECEAARRSERLKERRATDPEYRDGQRAYQKRYRSQDEVRVQRRDYQRHKYQTDAEFREAVKGRARDRQRRLKAEAA